MQQLRKCITQRCSKKIDGGQIYLLYETLWKELTNMHIFSAEDRVWSYQRDYLQALMSAVHEKIMEMKPHLLIGHIMSKDRPT